MLYGRLYQVHCSFSMPVSSMVYRWILAITALRQPRSSRSWKQSWVNPSLTVISVTEDSGFNIVMEGNNTMGVHLAGDLSALDFFPTAHWNDVRVAQSHITGLIP